MSPPLVGTVRCAHHFAWHGERGPTVSVHIPVSNASRVMHGLGAVAHPTVPVSLKRGGNDVRCLRSGGSKGSTPVSTRRPRTTTYAAKAPFPPSGIPEANGIVPGIGKGMPKWPEVWSWLREEKKMKTIDSKECSQLMKRGAVLLDVRFEPDYEKWSVPGSVSVPYVLGGFLAKLRLPGFKKKNVDFVAQVESAIPDKKTKIILTCIWGGSLVREPPKNRGLTDDTKGAGSLPGAFELYQAGYTNLYHLYGGVNQYYQDCAFDKSLVEGEGTWPGDIEWFGYRQFNGKDRLKGQRDD